MTPEIKAAINKEAEKKYPRVNIRTVTVLLSEAIDGNCGAFKAGAEYGYKLGLLAGRIATTGNILVKNELEKELQELL